MSRKSRLLLNSVSAVIKQLITLACGFVLPRYMLVYFGSEANGLVSSISQFLSFISFLELGIGAVVQSSLYGPLARKDTKQISEIVRSAERFFRTIATIFVAYIFCLCIIYPNIIESSFSHIYIVSLIVIIALSNVAQYFFGITYSLLLNADQKSYIVSSITASTILANTVLSIVVMKLGGTIHMVRLTTSIVYLFRPVFFNLYVRKKYTINKKIVYSEEPIKQKWNGMIQHFASVITGNTDIVVLSIFSTLTSVSVYSVYHNVAYGIANLMMVSATGLESAWGNMLANNEQKELLTSFRFIEWLLHSFVSIVFCCAGILIVPFVKVYTAGLSDADYINPLFGALLVTAFAIQCLRIPYYRIIKAAGHYKQTQTSAIIQGIINIVASIVLVIKYSLIGVAIGTVLSMLYHTFYCVYYIHNNIIHISLGPTVKQFIVDALFMIVCCFLASPLSMGNVSYISWAFLSLKVLGIAIISFVILNLLFQRKYILKGINLLRKKG